MSEHPKRELISYLLGELAPSDREQLAAHLSGCADCQRQCDTFREILDDLRGSVAPPPTIQWSHYRAELRQKLEARAQRSGSALRSWFGSIPATLSVALIAGIVVLAVLGGNREGPQRELTAFEEAILGSQLDLLRQYSVVEQLELLEDFEVIALLDSLAPEFEG